jgi:ADP-heptose:LPS heptosyltransferase
MIYYLIYIILWPIVVLLSLFRKKRSTNLIIQTAKIGDYVNTSIMFEPLKNTDIIIDNINISFAKNDNRVENIFIIDDYKINLFTKISLAFKIFFNNYQNVYVLIPNSFNLFIAKMSFAKNKTTIIHYSNKWYEKLFMYNMNKIKHTKDYLTLDTYLKMIGKQDINHFSKSIPVISPNNKLINSSKFKVGISLTAGNKLKTIDHETWVKIFNILSFYDLEIYFFGLSMEEKYLENIKPYINNNYISLLGKISLEHLAYHIKQMNLYISSDTGNSYIADTFNIPLINFAGPCFMDEQKPIGKNALIINSNAKCTPFSFIFQAPYETNCTNLYTITQDQEKAINKFIKEIYISFQY